MRPSARIESMLSAILAPLMRWAVVGMQVGLYATAVFGGILAYGSFVARRVYPFIETLLHFSLALLVATLVPLLFDKSVKRLRRRAMQSTGRFWPVALAILLSVCAVGAVFCLPLLEPLYDAARAMISDGLQGRLRSEDPARMPLSALMTFFFFTFLLLIGLLLSLRHSFGLIADLHKPAEPTDAAPEIADITAMPESRAEPVSTDHRPAARPSPWDNRRTEDPGRPMSERQTPMQ